MRSRIAEALFGEMSEAEMIAHYEIERCIGSGGMGVVYSAYDRRLDRPVALKLLRKDTMSAHHKQRLIDEARALAKLSHPNVVQVYEVGEHECDVYIAMELIRGETLWDWQQSKRRNWQQTVRRYRAAGAGLAAAHDAGIVHRDFKPTNVLVGEDDRARVADFGLAIENSHFFGETPNSSFTLSSSPPTQSSLEHLATLHRNLPTATPRTPVAISFPSAYLCLKLLRSAESKNMARASHEASAPDGCELLCVGESSQTLHKGGLAWRPFSRP